MKSLLMVSIGTLLFAAMLLVMLIVTDRRADREAKRAEEWQQKYNRMLSINKHNEELRDGCIEGWKATIKQRGLR